VRADTTYRIAACTRTRFAGRLANVSQTPRLGAGPGDHVTLSPTISTIASSCRPHRPQQPVASRLERQRREQSGERCGPIKPSTTAQSPTALRHAESAQQVPRQGSPARGCQQDLKHGRREHPCSSSSSVIAPVAPLHRNTCISRCPGERVGLRSTRVTAAPFVLRVWRIGGRPGWFRPCRRTPADPRAGLG
jgi:hypothetical protein